MTLVAIPNVFFVYVAFVFFFSKLKFTSSIQVRIKDILYSDMNSLVSQRWKQRASPLAFMRLSFEFVPQFTRSHRYGEEIVK